MRVVRNIVLLAITLPATLARPIFGQETSRTETVVVRYIAGPNIYVDLGVEDGLASGDTVQVQVPGRRKALLRVVNASARKTVLTFADTPFAISRGDRVRLTFAPHRVSEESPERSASDAAALPARNSIMAAPGGESRHLSRSRPPRVDGRLSISYQTFTSSTRSSATGDEIDRTFSTPSARLRLSVRNLPGDLTVNANVHASYRHSSQEIFSPSFLPRLYRLSITRELGVAPGAIEIGRFYSPFENFSGYWDGILLHLGADGFGGGFASGFQPERSNERFTAELPKYMAYVHFSQRLGEGNYSADLSVHSVRPRNELLEHSFFGLRQSWRRGPATVSSEIQADRDPENNEWVVTRLVGRMVVPAGPVRFRAGYSQRRPYSIWRSSGVISYRRDRVDGGVQFVLPGGVVGVGLISNATRGDDPYLTYTSYFSLPRTVLGGLGFSGSASYWSRDEFSAASASVGVSRSWSFMSPRMSYQYYRTQAPTGLVVTHAVSLSASFRVSRQMGGHVQSRTQFGELLFSQVYNVGMWVSF